MKSHWRMQSCAVEIWASALGAFTLLAACSAAGDAHPPSRSTTVGGGGSAPSKPSPSTGGGLELGNVPPNGMCTDLTCQVPVCAAGTTTTLKGKVYDPAGKVPLYNALVYVPSKPVEAFEEGATCDRCGATVLDPITSAITDETGSFVLEDPPAGHDIPLVIQVGKWRRQITVPMVAACAETALDDPQLTRLPRNHLEGDIPRIAIAVGGADQMECLPRRLGIDDAEFTTKGGAGRIHLYRGEDIVGTNGTDHHYSPKAFDPSLNGGAAYAPATELWQSVDSLKKYDIVMLSCEGGEGDLTTNKSPAAREAMYRYASEGGRVFASHWHRFWFSKGPAPLPTTGQWGDRNDPIADGGSLTASVNQSFPKGAALAKWLVSVGASTTAGRINVTFPRDNIQSVNPATSTEWISLDNPADNNAKAVEYLSFNTPVGAPEEQVCGRAVFTGLHVSATKSFVNVTPQNFPKDCEARDLSAQEKAMAFMLFDLSACVQSDQVPPKPPK